MKRSNVGAGPVGKRPAAVDASFAGRFPLLAEHLLVTVWEEDGSAREVSTLLIFAEDGRWKARLADRAEGRAGWVSGETFQGLLEALENGLAREALDWRPLPAWDGRRGKRG